MFFFFVYIGCLSIGTHQILILLKKWPLRIDNFEYRFQLFMYLIIKKTYKKLKLLWILNWLIFSHVHGYYFLFPTMFGRNGALQIRLMTYTRYLSISNFNLSYFFLIWLYSWRFVDKEPRNIPRRNNGEATGPKSHGAIYAGTV